jgi:hypothetical protein
VGGQGAGKELSMKGKGNNLKSAPAVHAVAVAAVLVPLAALAGGMDLGNHNETFLRDA